MIDEPVNALYAYVQAFVDELQRSGVHNIVICPGSRSTPLALAIASHPGIRAWMHVDERSAAFFGLGMTKRLGQPVALLCTSGTAAANFLPAITEAKLTHLPLLILTADRPHELRDCGAPQAIDQNRLYGTHVKWFAEVALPEANDSALRYIRTLANRAAALTLAVPAGPVHLNLPFREPLMPAPFAATPLPPLDQRDPVAWRGRDENMPYVTVNDAPLATPSEAIVQTIARQAWETGRGLIIVGPQNDPALIAPLLQLAVRLGYPILADPLSQLRGGTHERLHVLTSYDAFLRLDLFVEQAEPSFILRFGAMPTAKPLLLYLKRYADCPQIVVDGQGGWDEPTQFLARMVHTEPAAFCHALLKSLDNTEDEDRERDQSNWLAHWQKTERVTRTTLLRAIEHFSDRFEGRVFTELAAHLPDGVTLFAGNSMPVRDLDTFFWETHRRIRVLGNRGANGIDGIISTALGISAASPGDERVVLVIGDLSFYHDLNGLLAARLHQLNLTVILVNNDGGGIFSFLPQAAYPEHFEQLFGTPTGLDFRLAVEMYGGSFQRVEIWKDFRRALDEGLTTGGLHVLEVQTERTSNVTMHRELWKTVEQALRQAEVQA
jgi:2-succinyl-5-enolpyruvyl-6-hydroxy-3-cyclohexene-1-carboxylate synthase